MVLEQDSGGGETERNRTGEREAVVAVAKTQGGGSGIKWRDSARRKGGIFLDIT